MDVMNATLRKVDLKAGGLAAAFSVAMGAGMAVALRSQGQDPTPGLQATVPLFIGALAVLAGVHPARAPKLFAGVMVGAASCMALVQAIVPPLS